MSTAYTNKFYTARVEQYGCSIDSSFFNEHAHTFTIIITGTGLLVSESLILLVLVDMLPTPHPTLPDIGKRIESSERYMLFPYHVIFYNHAGAGLILF